MNEAHQREATLFDAALELPPAERAAYLDHACGGDTALRQRVEALLKGWESQCEFLDSPADPALRETFHITVRMTEKPGDRIGRYKVLEQIGEGGCGVVYVAEQEEPVRRRVALKIIKLGMDTKSVIARFANLYVEMTRVFNEGKVKPQRGRIPDNSTPTQFEDFAGELARAYAEAAL
jgi:eukaryotic-like serine/threonine-protein kinase